MKTNSNSLFYYRFNNFRNLFTLRGFVILVATIVLSFSVRCLIIYLFSLDLSISDELVFLGVLLSFGGFICDSLYDLFSTFLPESLQCEGTDKGKGKASNKVEYNDQTYLRPVAYNPNANIRTSRGNFRVSYTDKIEYGRKLEPVSCDKTPQSLSSVSFTRPISDYNKGDDVIRFVPKSSRANVTTPASPLIRPTISTAQAGPSAPRPSNLSTPRSLSPLFPIATPVSPLIPSNPQNIVELSELSTRVKRVKYVDTIPAISSEVLKIENPRISITDTNREFAIRRAKITKAINAQMDVHSIKEMVVDRVGLFGKVKLGFCSVGSKLETIHIKYNSIGRRKLLWTVWENRKGNFSSYDEFKTSWSRDTSIWKTIKDDIKVNLENKVNKILDKRRPFDNPVIDRSKSGVNPPRVTNRNHIITRDISNNRYRLAAHNIINDRDVRNQTVNDSRIKHNIDSDRHNLNDARDDTQSRSERTHRRHKTHRTHRTHRSHGTNRSHRSHISRRH